MREIKRDAKRRGMWIFLFIGLLLGSSGGVFLSCRNPGLKYYRNYSPEEYKYQPQNWCIIQDRSGIIYVANNGGVMEYDITPSEKLPPGLHLLCAAPGRIPIVFGWEWQITQGHWF